ncbi:MAG TPA: hypothetical protein VEH04_08095 [Verrucomicrobiae bacterium]|nr:hypothetical protein [Verrucomicrobiae bacterium]
MSGNIARQGSEPSGIARLPIRRLFIAAIAAGLLTGCATTREPAIVLTGNLMVDGPNAIERGPAKDKVLWQYRTAAAAMRRGEFELAKRYLDDALLTLGGIYGRDKSARKARGYFNEESRKTFIGEPYERVMAYFYRGVLYWMDGEPDNARACFRTAQLEDSGTEEQSFAADYAILDYLDGLASVKLGGDGSDSLQRAEKASKLSRLPPYNPAANVLFLIEYGRGPAKYGGGEYGEQLRFRETPSPVRLAKVTVGEQLLSAGACDDLFYQATTRGGRLMDHVLGNKAVFKSTTGAIGDVGIIGGAVMATQRGRNSVADEVGLGLLAAGVLSKLVSSATTPEADVRAWDNLPRFLTFAHLQLPPGIHSATIEFQDGAGRPLTQLTKSFTINVPETGDKVVFVSDQSVTPQTL